MGICKKHLTRCTEISYTIYFIFILSIKITTFVKKCHFGSGVVDFFAGAGIVEGLKTRPED